MSGLDIVIIGGGVGGYTAALRGVQLGLKIALIEKDQIGGVCLNRGCIPTKTIVSSARVFDYLKNAREYGLYAENIHYDFAKIIKRKDQIVKRLTLGVQSLLKARKVQVITGTAKIVEPGKVIIYRENRQKEMLLAKNIIIATGSSGRHVPIAGLHHKGVIDTDEALTIGTLPEKISVIGAGYSGIEFASIFRHFDVNVDVVDILERILLPVDEEIANSLFQTLKKKGICFSLNSQVKHIEKKGKNLIILIESGSKSKEVKAESVLVSTGRIPDFGGIDVDKLGIEKEGEGIKVDSFMRTNIPGIYAVGDVVAKKMLAHVASMQGQVAVLHIAGMSRPMNYQIVPFCVFSNPEVASVGINEEEAKNRYKDVSIFKFPYRANGKALGMGEKEGYVKMIDYGKNQKIAGIHIIGAHASDLIAEATLSLKMGCGASDIAETIHAHPTLSETMAEAAEGILGYPIHVLR